MFHMKHPTYTGIHTSP